MTPDQLKQEWLNACVDWDLAICNYLPRNMLRIYRDEAWQIYSQLDAEWITVEEEAEWNRLQDAAHMPIGTQTFQDYIEFLRSPEAMNKQVDLQHGIEE